MGEIEGETEVQREYKVAYHYDSGILVNFR